MTQRLAGIPPYLDGVPFSLADGLAAGLTLAGMRHPRFEAPHRGVRSSAPRPHRRETSRERTLRAAAEYLPLLRIGHGEAFSHTTALMLHGAPIRIETAPAHVSIPLPHGPARSSGVQGHNTAVPFESVLIRDERLDYPCVPAAVALIQSAPLLGFRELVIAIDHLIRWRDNGTVAPVVVHAELVELLGVTTASGIRRLRLAARVARVGAESRMETVMHYELAKLGLDVLELQGALYDERGAFIGRFDAMDRSKRRILEYDGEQHRTSRRQYLTDEKRLESARELGFKVLRLHKEDFAEGALPGTAERMCEFLDERPRGVSPELARCFAEPERS